MRTASNGWRNGSFSLISRQLPRLSEVDCCFLDSQKSIKHLNKAKDAHPEDGTDDLFDELFFTMASEEEGSPHRRDKRRVTRAVRPTKRIEFTEADGEPEGKIVFQLEKESEHETFKIRDENPWVTVEPNGAVRVKKKWDYEELGREKTIDFWVIITNSGSGGETLQLSL